MAKTRARLFRATNNRKLGIIVHLATLLPNRVNLGQQYKIERICRPHSTLFAMRDYTPFQPLIITFTMQHVKNYPVMRMIVCASGQRNQFGQMEHELIH